MNNFKSVLEEIGYSLIDFGSHWRTSAVYRGGDNPMSIQIYKDTGIWTDFGSDEGYFPFVLLVQKTLNTTNPDILRKYSLEKGVSKFKETKKRTLLTEEKTFDDNCLERLLPHYDFYTNKSKNISVETLREYQGGLATSGKFYQRFVFPIRNRNKKIVGFSGRTMSDNQIKWLHSGRRNSWVYPYFNLDKVSDSIVNNDVFLVESIGDSLSMYERGIPNHLVTFGLSIGPSLNSLLMALDTNRIIISLNNNPTAFDASIKIFVKLSQFLPIGKLMVIPPTKEDFGDITDGQEMQEFLSNARAMPSDENHLTFVNRLQQMIKENNPQSFKTQAKKVLQYIEL